MLRLREVQQSKSSDLGEIKLRGDLEHAKRLSFGPLSQGFRAGRLDGLATVLVA